MILIDTGPLVAFFDRSDAYHDVCLDALKQMQGPLLSVWPVLTEAFYLLGFSWRAQTGLWDFLIRGGVRIVHQEGRSLQRCKELMEKYKDLPMDMADAALCVLAETSGLTKIFTLDHRDFGIYQPAHALRFELIPPHL
jgi:hypothetical protein